MNFAKPVRWPYFDFNEQLRLFPTLAQPRDATRALALSQARKRQRDAALQAYFARLNGHFEESFDAITLCRFSDAGRSVFRSGHRYEQKPQTLYYCLSEDGWMSGGSAEEARTGFPKGRTVSFVGGDMLFGRLHAHVARLDAHIFGPHPIGTIVQLTAADNTVKAETAQSLSGRFLHIDGSPAQLERGRFQATYDYMDDSDLSTRYARGFTPKPSDELYASLYSTAACFHGSGIDRRLENPAYMSALAGAEPRLWTAERNSIVMRASLTPHMGQLAKTATRRAHAHMVIARP